MKKLSFILLLVIFISCEGPKKHCVLRYRSSNKVCLFRNSLEVIVNYRLHAIDHDSTLSELPCRYKVSYLDKSGENKTEIIFEDQIKAQI